MFGLDEKVLELRSLARNEVLFRQGDKVAAIYFIEAGRLRLERLSFDGRLLVLGITPAGQFFVEAALLPTSSIATPWPRSRPECAFIQNRRS
jgi:CRP-like cAMP-binding protein